MKGKKVLKILAVTLVVLVGIGFALFRVANYIYDNAEIQQGEWGPYEVVKIQSIGPITEDGTEFTPVVGFGYNLAPWGQKYEMGRNLAKDRVKARRMKEVRSAELGKAQKALGQTGLRGKYSQWRMGVKSKDDIKGLEEAYIKDRQESFKNLDHDQVKAKFREEWDTMGDMDRRALFRTMIDRKAMPDADEHELWRKLADPKLGARALWVDDPEIFSAVLKDTPDVPAKIGIALDKAGIDFTADFAKDDPMKDIAAKLKVANGLSLAKKGSDWKADQVKWMAAFDVERLMGALKNKATVNDIMMGNNRDLQKAIGNFLIENSAKRKTLSGITDEDHRRCLANLIDVARTEKQKAAAKAAAGNQQPPAV